jgi:hypothetical protein
MKAHTRREPKSLAYLATKLSARICHKQLLPSSAARRRLTVGLFQPTHSNALIGFAGAAFYAYRGADHTGRRLHHARMGGTWWRPATPSPHSLCQEQPRRCVNQVLFLVQRLAFRPHGWDAD